MSLVVNVNNEILEELIIDKSYKKIVIAIFYAKWCEPSQKIIDNFINLLDEFENSITIVKVDIDKEYKCIKKFAIRGVPDIKIFSEGEVLEEFMGHRDIDELIDTISKYTNSKTKDIIKNIKKLMNDDIKSAYELANEYKESLINNSDFKLLYTKILLKIDKKDEAIDLLVSFKKTNKHYNISRNLLSLTYNVEDNIINDELDWMYSSVLEFIANDEVNRAIMLLLNIIQKDKNYKNSLAQDLLKHIIKTNPIPPSLASSIKEIL